MRRYTFIIPLVAVALPYLLFESIRNGIFIDPYLKMPSGHFYIVSVVAFMATIIAIAVGIAGRSLRNIKVSFLALAFISLAQVFSIHGLSTPHFLLPETNIPGVTSQLSILLATIWLWLSTIPTDRLIVVQLSSWQGALLPVWVIILACFGLVTMLVPNIISFIPLNLEPLNWLITGFIILLNTITIYRYYQTYKFSRFPLQLAIVYCAGWFIVSQLIIVMGETWKLSWWMYHFLLLFSMIAMLFGILKQYTVKGSFVGSIRALFTNDPFERISDSSSPSVKALVHATEKKDRYTVGHTLRVTLYALRLAEELDLKQEQLRAIAQGTLVHDVGKISIPDAILNKPGKLSKEEREVIEMHPVYGYEMVRNLGFMKEELSIIRSHHEKWDGTGYPDKLQGKEIPLLARIVAVADVYDALTSERSYRKAWEHSEAMNYLVQNKGSHFDPACVDAWVRLCEKNPAVYQYPTAKITNDTTRKLLSSF